MVGGKEGVVGGGRERVQCVVSGSDSSINTCSSSIQVKYNVESCLASTLPAKLSSVALPMHTCPPNRPPHCTTTDSTPSQFNGGQQLQQVPSVVVVQVEEQVLPIALELDGGKLGGAGREDAHAHLAPLPDIRCMTIRRWKVSAFVHLKQMYGDVHTCVCVRACV